MGLNKTAGVIILALGLMLEVVQGIRTSVYVLQDLRLLLKISVDKISFGAHNLS